MTSYTRKLYSRDPAAAVAFHRQSKVERAMATHSQPYDPAKDTETKLQRHGSKTIHSRRLDFLEGH